MQNQELNSDNSISSGNGNSDYNLDNIRKNRIKHDMENKLVLILFGIYIVLILVNSVVIPFNILKYLFADVSEKTHNQMTYYDLFWIYDIVFDGLRGVSSMLLEFMVLEVQPTAYLVPICVGFGVACVGLLWHLSYI